LLHLKWPIEQKLEQSISECPFSLLLTKYNLKIKGSLSCYLWSNVDKATFNTNILEIFGLDNEKKAKAAIKAAFNNCRKCKHNTDDMKANFDKYETTCNEIKIT
jgi:hypothetical protein